MIFAALFQRLVGQRLAFSFYRLFLVFLLLTTYYLLLATPVSAQSQTNPYTVPNTNPDVPKNLHTWTQNVMIEVMSAMSCQLSGIDPTNPKAQCLGVDQKTGKIGYVEGGGGAIGVAGHMIAMLYTPPLRTGDYFKYLANNFGIVKPAHAATGFEGLKPVQNLWVAFRNVVYLLFVIIFIVIGLAIMLRVRIDPRTVMTIQNQIPKIIIGILLVTFSFAIAGFLIDLMYVVIFLSYELISGVKGVDVASLNPLTLQGQTAIGAAGNIGNFRGLAGVAGIAGTAAGSITAIVTSLFGLDHPFSAVSVIIHLISVGLATFLGVQSGQVTVGSIAGNSIPQWPVALAFIASYTFIIEKLLRDVIPNILFFLIIFIALFFALIRLWFSLIIAYVSILIDVVFAPFWIAAALFPGSPIGFGAWIRSIVSNLAAFPATIIMFLLAKAFIDGFGTTQTSDQFVPPLIGDPGSTDAIGALIGLGIILMTHNVVHLVKAALKAPATPFGAIGAAIGVGTGVISSPVGIAGHIATGGFSYALSERIRRSRLPFVGQGRGAGGGGGTP